MTGMMMGVCDFTSVAGAAPAFDPTTYGTVYGWYDYSDNSKCLTSAPAACVDGDAIATITDKSSNGFNGSQATLGNRPIYKTAIKNGLSVARLTAASSSGHVLPSSRGYVNARTGLTVAIVFSLRAGATNSGLFCALSNTSAGHERIACYADTASDLLSIGTERVDGAGVTYRSGTAATEGTWYVGIFFADFTGGKSEAWLNGSAVIANGASSTAGTTSATNSGWDPEIGSLDNRSTYFATVDIGDVILYSNLLNSTNAGNLNTALRTKWGI